MFRLLGIAAAVSLACGIPASAKTSCRVEVSVCTVACSDGKAGTCKQRCRTLICEAQPTRLAKGRMPDSKLPADQLPQSHMPDGHLPD
jgi:hypothetical protein